MPLCSMKDGNDREFAFVWIYFVHNDVRKSGNRPFIGVADATDMTEMRELREPVAIGEDATDDVRGGRGTAVPKIERDGVDMSERFRREAQSHDRYFCLTVLTSASVASRADPSRKPRRMRCTSAT